MEELGKITKTQDGSLETKAKIVQALSPQLLCVGGKAGQSGTTWFQEGSADPLDIREDEQVGPGANEAGSVPGGKDDS